MSDTEQEFFRRTSRSHPIAPLAPDAIHERVVTLLHSGGFDQVASLIEVRGSQMKTETLTLIADHPEFEGYFDLPIGDAA